MLLMLPRSGYNDNALAGGLKYGVPINKDIQYMHYVD